MLVKSLIFINAFAVAIGAILIFLEKVIANYGDVQITINEDKELTAPGGKSLLKVLFENKYFIPSACGGKGTCGYCKLQVKKGGGDPLPTESLILSPSEGRRGFRLSCQLKVRGDLGIMIPPEYLEIKEYEGEIVSSELVTSDIRKVKIKVPGEDEVIFKPGQYVQVKFDNNGTVDYRAYSLASSPDDVKQIELNVKLVPEGVGSAYIHSLREGDPVQFSGPYGDFFLNSESKRPMICAAGGVGLAPIKSIVEYWASHDKERELSLYYGSRTQADLYDHEMFEKLAGEYPHFHYCPCLSGDDADWKGERGFVHLLMEKELENAADSEAYLCGPPIMIDSVIKVLRDKGVPEDRILFDKF